MYDPHAQALKCLQDLQVRNGNPYKKKLCQGHKGRTNSDLPDNASMAVNQLRVHKLYSFTAVLKANI